MALPSQRAGKQALIRLRKTGVLTEAAGPGRPYQPGFASESPCRALGSAPALIRLSLEPAVGQSRRVHTSHRSQTK